MAWKISQALLTISEFRRTLEPRVLETDTPNRKFQSPSQRGRFEGRSDYGAHW